MKDIPIKPRIKTPITGTLLIKELKKKDKKSIKPSKFKII